MSLARQVPADGKQYGVVRRITAALESLTPAERRVADRVIADPSQVVVLSIGDFAVECGVAQPTLSRFARSLGFPGYPALRFAIAHDIAVGGTDAEAAPSGLDRLGDQLRADSAISDLAAALRSSSGAELWASAELAGVAELTAARLQSVGIPAAGSSTSGHWGIRAAGVRPGSVVVLLLTSALDRRSDRAVETARDRGATIVLVSAGHLGPGPQADLAVLLPDADSPELAGAVFADVLAVELAALGQEVGPEGPASPWLPWPHVRELLVPTGGDPVPALLLQRRPGDIAAPVVVYFSGFTGPKENGLPPGAPRDRIGPGIVAALLNAGYSVLLVDAPAHGERKRAWEEPRRLVAESLSGDGDDLQELSRRTMRSIVTHLIDRGIVPSGDRIGVLGQSWGGYQALLSLEGDDRLAVGVAIMPITHAADLPEFADHRDDDRGRSAAIADDRIVTPLLLVSGLDDTVARPERIRALHDRLAPAFAARDAVGDLAIAELTGVGHHLDAAQVELALRFLDEHLPVDP